ncbi:hypothetical protein SAMN04487996_12656 [Dyadobacter soli]|uniref:Uncharacterized protein n=1 Tax=Dyadobacter soli TaxID=659014 RepID=A0A1G7YKY9_9BACT|nr:hypothetical protein SAMN04487996_12656 [Dyadobacter soli]
MRTNKFNKNSSNPKHNFGDDPELISAHIEDVQVSADSVRRITTIAFESVWFSINF